MSLWSKLKSAYKKLVGAANKSAGNRSGGSNSSKPKKPSQSSNSKPKSSGSSSSGSRPSSSSTSSSSSRSYSSGTTSRTSSGSYQRRSGAVSSSRKTHTNTSRSGAITSARSKSNERRTGAITVRENNPNITRITDVTGGTAKYFAQKIARDVTEATTWASKQAAKKQGVGNRGKSGQIHAPTKNDRLSEEQQKQVEKFRRQEAKNNAQAKKMVENDYKDAPYVKSGERVVQRLKKAERKTLNEAASNFSGKKNHKVLGHEFSDKDIVKGGIKTAKELADYLVPYGGTTKASMRAAESVLKASKAAKAGKVLTETGEKGAKFLSADGKKLVREYAEKVAKGADKDDALKELTKKISRSDLKQNIKKEMLANAMQDASIGTALDLAKGKQEGLEGKDLAKYMGQNAAMNFVAGGVVSGLAGRTGKAGKRALSQEAASIANKEYKSITKLTKEEGRELVNLQYKKGSRSMGGLTEAENARYNELIDKTRRNDNDLATVNAKGNVIADPNEAAQNALTKTEATEYTRLKATESVRNLSTNERAKLDNLTAKVEYAKATNEARIKLSVSDAKANINKAGASDVSNLSKAVTHYEKMGMTAEAKEARNLLVKAEKNFTNTVDNVTKAAAKISHDLGREFKIESADEIAEAFAKTGGYVDDPSQIHGFAEFDKDGNIVSYHVNKDSDQAMEFTFGHELTHGFESLGKEYDDFASAIKNYVGEEEWADMLSSVERQYGGIANADYEKEAVANLVGKHLFAGDDKFLRHLMGEKPNLFQRVYDFLRKLLKGSSESDRQLEALSKQMDDMLDSLSEEKKSIILGSPETSEMLFGGGRTLQDLIDRDINAETARELQKSLQDAKDGSNYAIKQSKGDYKELAKARKQIFKDTGWFQGDDGKWRFEIDDSRMRFSGGMKIGSTHKDGSLVFYDKLSGKMAAATQDTARHIEEEIARLSSKAKLTKKEKMKLDGMKKQLKFRQLFTKKGVPLGDALEHESFYKLYPEARDIKFKLSASAKKGFGDIKKGDLSFSAGAYVPDPTGKTQGTLYINAHMLNEDTKIYKALVERGDEPSKYVKEVITHELQHYVQDIERFAEGGEPNMFKRAIEQDETLFPKKNADSKKLSKLMDDREDLEFDLSDIDDGGFDEAVSAYFDILKGAIKDDRRIQTYRPSERAMEIDAKRTNAGIGFDDYLEDLGGYFGYDNPQLSGMYVDNMYNEIKNALNVGDSEYIVNKKFDDKFKEYLEKDFEARSLAESNPSKLYKRLAGENEAFKSQDRTFMSKSERKRNYPVDENTEPIFAKEGYLVKKEAFKRNNVELSERGTETNPDIRFSVGDNKTKNASEAISDEELAYYNSLSGETVEDEANAAEAAARGAIVNPAEDIPTKGMRKAERDAANESMGYRLSDKDEQKVLDWMDEDEARPQWEKDLDDKLFNIAGTDKMTNFKRQRTRLMKKGEWNEESANTLLDKIINAEPKVNAAPKAVDNLAEETAKADKAGAKTADAGKILDDEDFEPTPEMKKAERDAAGEGSRYLDENEVEPKLKENTIPEPEPVKEVDAHEEATRPMDLDGVIARTRRMTKAKDMNKSAVRDLEDMADFHGGLTEYAKMMRKDGAFGKYGNTSAQQALGKAEADMKSVGYEDLLDKYLKSSFDSDPYEIRAQGVTLLNEISRRIEAGDGSTEQLWADAYNVIEKNSSMTGFASKTMLAQKDFLTATRDGRARVVMKEIERLEKRYASRIKGGKLNVDRDLLNRLLDATGDEKDKLLHEINTQLWEQIPASFMERLNEYRHCFMLFNVKTHGRNVFGNTVFRFARAVSDEMEAGILKASQGRIKKLDAKTGGKTDINKVHVGFNDIRENRKYLEDEFKAIYEKSGSRNKYIEMGRPEDVPTVKFKPMQKLIDLNYKALEKEDIKGALGPAFNKAYTSYCKARCPEGTSLKNFMESMTPAQKEKARNYAMFEGEYATFRDTCAFSDWLIGKKQTFAGMEGKTKWGTYGYRALDAVLEGAIPFVKTPVNVFRRSVDYSPASILFSVGKLARAKSAEEFMLGVHQLSTGLTGTGMMGLGVYLSQQGMVTVKAGEESGDAYYDRDMGFQDYSLKFQLGDKQYSWTLDWMAPMGMSLFAGAAFEKMFEKEGFDNQSALNAFFACTSPITDMSFMSSPKDTLERFMENASRGSDEKETDFSGALAQLIVGDLPKNYVSGFFPQLMAQTAGFLDPVQRDTRSTNENVYLKGWESSARQLAAKVPVLRQYLLNPKINRRGEDVVTGGNIATRLANAYVNPANVKEINENETDRELINIRNHMDKDSKDYKYFYYNLTGNPPYNLAAKVDGRKRMTYDEAYTYGKSSRIEQNKRIETMMKADSYGDMNWKMKADEVDDAHWIGATKADMDTYGANYAMKSMLKNNEHEKESVKEYKRLSGLPREEANAKYIKYYLNKERILARSHATGDDVYRIKGIAAIESNDENLLKALDIHKSKIDDLTHYFGIVQNETKDMKKTKKTVFKEMTDACCRIMSRCNDAEVSNPSKGVKSVSAGMVAVDGNQIAERVYRAYGHNWNSAQSGGGLMLKYNKDGKYSIEGIQDMKSTLRNQYDTNDSGSVNKEEVIKYINSLGIKSDDEKACLYEVLYNGGRYSNPFKSQIDDHLKWGENHDDKWGTDTGSGYGGWGRRGFGGWGGGGFGGWGSGGGSGSGGATPPATETGAIKKATVSKVGKKSNLDDVYRKKAKKLLEANRKKLS